MWNAANYGYLPHVRIAHLFLSLSILEQYNACNLVPVLTSTSETQPQRVLHTNILLIIGTYTRDYTIVITYVKIRTQPSQTFKCHFTCFKDLHELCALCNILGLALVSTENHIRDSRPTHR